MFRRCCHHRRHLCPPLLRPLLGYCWLGRKSVAFTGEAQNRADFELKRVRGRFARSAGQQKQVEQVAQQQEEQVEQVDQQQ